MSADPNFRKERIEKLLHELRYEVERGILENEVDEQLGFRFVIPLSRSIQEGVVMCEFRTRPMHRYAVDTNDLQPRLRVVK